MGGLRHLKHAAILAIAILRRKESVKSESVVADTDRNQYSCGTRTITHATRHAALYFVMELKFEKKQPHYLYLHPKMQERRLLREQITVTAHINASLMLLINVAAGMFTNQAQVLQFNLCG